MDGQIQKEGLKPQRGGEELGQEHLWHLEAPIPSLGVQGLCHLPHRLSAKETLELMMGLVPSIPPKASRSRGHLSPCAPSVPRPLVSPLSLTSQQYRDTPLKHHNLSGVAELRFVRGSGIMLLCFTGCQGFRSHWGQDWHFCTFLNIALYVLNPF